MHAHTHPHAHIRAHESKNWRLFGYLLLNVLSGKFFFWQRFVFFAKGFSWIGNVLVEKSFSPGKVLFEKKFC